MKNTEFIRLVLPAFFEGIEKSSMPDNIELFACYESFSDMMMEAVYILDFQKRNFHYVGHHDFFLCGYSQEEAMNLGYNFFREVIHPEDLLLWAKMHNAILKFLRRPDLQVNGINYFSCAFRIRNRLQAGNKSGYLMAYQKLKPKWMNGELRLGICLLSCSVIPKPGHLEIYYKSSPDYDKYSFESQKWKRQKVSTLSERQKWILMLDKQGRSHQEMANIICVSVKTIEKEISSLFEKLGVNSMGQAVIYATNHRLIFDCAHSGSKGQVKKIQPIKKQRSRNKHTLTLDILIRIQAGLNNGRSVNSLAKEEKFSETAIRKAVKQGKLIQKG
jgi:DNA-binding CsgD family transcriptional regulator